MKTISLKNLPEGYNRNATLAIAALFDVEFIGSGYKTKYFLKTATPRNKTKFTLSLPP